MTLDAQRPAQSRTLCYRLRNLKDEAEIANQMNGCRHLQSATLSLTSELIWVKLFDLSQSMSARRHI
jgi:hypothetical protein